MIFMYCIKLRQSMLVTLLFLMVKILYTITLIFSQKQNCLINSFCYHLPCKVTGGGGLSVVGLGVVLNSENEKQTDCKI